MTHPTWMYYTMTTYFDIVRLQVLHSTLRSTSFVPQYIAYTVVTIVHLTFYTLHSLRCTLYATDTIQYFYIYRILYKMGLFSKSGKQLTLLQHSIIHSTQIDTLIDRTHGLSIKTIQKTAALLVGTLQYVNWITLRGSSNFINPISCTRMLIHKYTVHISRLNFAHR